MTKPHRKFKVTFYRQELSHKLIITKLKEPPTSTSKYLGVSLPKFTLDRARYCYAYLQSVQLLEEYLNLRESIFEAIGVSLSAKSKFRSQLCPTPDTYLDEVEGSLDNQLLRTLPLSAK